MSKKQNALICLVLILLTGSVFFRVAFCEFVNYDDPDYVTQNEVVQRGITWEGIRWAFGNLHGAATYWHPLTWLSHMLDVQLFGLNPRAHHLVSLFLHSSNVLLLFWLLQRMTGAVYRSALVAALFAVHPIQVDTVAWITERKNLLSGVFWFTTILAYHHYTLRPAIWRYLLALAAFTAGLMCKPVMVTLPFVLLLLDFWPLGRFRPRGKGLEKLPAEAGPSPVPLSRLLVEKIPFLVLAGVLAMMTIKAHEQLRSVQPLALSLRLENAFVSYFRYLWHAIYPFDLTVLYLHPGKWSPFVVLACAILLMTVTAFVLRRLHRNPYLAVGWFWFLGVHLPSIGLIQAGAQSMADRFMYLPLVGLWIALVWGASELVVGRPACRVVLSVAYAAILLVFCAVSWVQITYWKDSPAMWGRVVTKAPNSYVLHNIMAAVLHERKDLDGMMAHALEALRIKPDFAEARCKVAAVFYERGQTGAAITNYLETERLNPNWPTVPLLLGNIYAGEKDFRNAADQYRRALAIDPKAVSKSFSLDDPAYFELLIDSEAHPPLRTEQRIEIANNLAWILATNPDPEVRNGKEAVQYARMACELAGYRFPVLIGTLAAAYAEAGEFNLAVPTAEQALEMALAQGEKDLAEKNQKLLELYRAGKPYRQ